MYYTPSAGLSTESVAIKLVTYLPFTELTKLMKNYTASDENFQFHNIFSLIKLIELSQLTTAII